MKYCSYCGAKLKDDYDFCCYCGQECDPDERPLRVKSSNVIGLLILFIVLFLIVTGVFLNRELIAEGILYLIRQNSSEQPVSSAVSDSFGSGYYTNAEDSTSAYTMSDYTPLRYRGSLLNETEYAIYRKIADAVSVHAPSVTFTYGDVDRVLDLAGYVYYDYPEYFWFRGSCSADYHVSFGGFSGTVFLEYTCSETEYLSGQTNLDNSIQQILQSLSGRSDYEKVLGVYEYIINSTDYDSTSTDQGCYSVLVSHRGVCAGYSTAVSYLLNRLGIDSIYVSGFSEGELHAWNLVRLDGEWYHLDATWGDPETQDGQQVIRYDYLLVDDSVMLLDHSYSGDCVYPVCSSMTWNFFRIEGLFLTQYSYIDLYSMLNRCMISGRDFMFRCGDENVFRETEYQLFTNEVIWSLLRDAGYGSTNISYSSDPVHLTFYIDLF